MVKFEYEDVHYYTINPNPKVELKYQNLDVFHELCADCLFL